MIAISGEGCGVWERELACTVGRVTLPRIQSSHDPSRIDRRHTTLSINSNRRAVRRNNVNSGVSISIHIDVNPNLGYGFQ